MLYSIAAILVLILDQAVKYWTVRNIDPLTDQSINLIPGIVRMTNVQNRGAAFSIMADQRWLLVAVSVIFIVGIIVLISMDIIHTRFGRWTATLVMAGALGNCIDRALLGYVVDMFDFVCFNFAVFNVADIFITVCGILFCIHVIVYREPEEERNAVPRPVKVKKSRRAPRQEEDEYYDEYEEAPARPAKGRKAKKGAPPVRVARRRPDDDLPEQDEPFADWGDDDYGEPAPKAPAERPRAAQQPPARRRTAATVADDWDDYDLDYDLDMPAARPSPAPKRSAPPRQDAPAKPVQPAKRQDAAGYDDYSLEDILSEFRDL